MGRSFVAGIQFLQESSLLDAFLAKADWPRLRYPRDQHWNAEGHRVVGTALASAVRLLVSGRRP